MQTKPLEKKTPKPRNKRSTKRSPTDGGWPIVIPASASTLEDFRQWTASVDFPEKGKIAYLGGEIFIDMSAERLDSHNAVKAEIFSTLYRMVNELDLGKFYPDGARVVHVEANVSNEPDAMFVSWESFDSNRVRLVPAKKEDGFDELEGSPDIVAEILSPSSATKDLKKLRGLYWLAGIPEYWLIDARSEKLDFQILRASSKDYEVVAPKAGWHNSAVFGKSFRLSRKKDRVGTWLYRLEIK